MVARCETIGKLVLPVFRSLVARELVSTYHLTQVEAAEKLGTTQAAISQYLNSKRALKGAEQFSGIMPKLQAMASETARRLKENNGASDEIAIDFCKLCVTFSDLDASKISEDFSI